MALQVTKEQLVNTMSLKWSTEKSISAYKSQDTLKISLEHHPEEAVHYFLTPISVIDLQSHGVPCPILQAVAPGHLCWQNRGRHSSALLTF